MTSHFLCILIGQQLRLSVRQGAMDVSGAVSVGFLRLLHSVAREDVPGQEEGG